MPLALFIKDSIKTQIVPLAVVLGSTLSGVLYMGINAGSETWDQKTSSLLKDFKDIDPSRTITLNQKYLDRWDRERW
ncbi:hypothetical protein J3Q64DRAFT_1744492 [Phycomyces blakesleeanus]|uniref:Uncharacterized protein n=2 Tax=Phycomyces blakesleeanus TaxID=4837 RepID=A0A162U9M7_PHYB8|nr:hypothetical protein PHYBLDRAFT_145863 [Phycomyces blakesleeanus NRRL 1555(-)]OAD73473.1 hypothetical protein PHYBLDRAFT_145863 [Phycomyces blakesleeanus NRRL 1555(-)]|eukprot:XP_018291513.1 hypothetical protein PHYBLDRAFT_145863 [Phycomyces blakesleeanus NRRL 1555(-)]